MNLQDAEPKTKDDLIDVHSVFRTIQGEGPFAGERAIFVRLAGCNLKCKFCDTDYTQGRFKVDVRLLLKEINRMSDEDFNADPGNMLVVITGGEPFRQSALKMLVGTLLLDGFVVQIETNGTIYQALPYEHENLHIVCSPKSAKLHKTMVPYIQYYKYVGDHRTLSSTDGLPDYVLGDVDMAGVARPQNNNAQVFLQPVDHNDVVENALAVRAVTESVMKHGYTLCLQMHKIIGVE